MASFFRRSWRLLALVSLVFGFAYMVQGSSSNQGAHYALVRSLAEGTPAIDRTRRDLGDIASDVSYVDGHYYAAKAPGLAFFTLPVYLVLKAAGARTTGDPTAMVWALGLWGALLPALLLVLLVERVGARVEPGFGTAAGVALGLGTLLLPFATLFFSHALSALLAFAAFAILWREREGPGDPLLVGVAGVLVGYAITTELPNVLVAVAFGLYALVSPGRARRGLVYGSGVLLGATPLLLYNWWAFGSVAHVPYADVLRGLNESGFFGVGAPDFYTAVQLLFSSTIGLFTFGPVAACGIAGIFVLHRRGRRAEALLIGALALAFLIYNSGYWEPFGGASPGPRLLVTILPFLALPLPLAFRVLPGPTAALAVASAAAMAVVTATGPTLARGGGVPHRLESGEFSATVPNLFGVSPGSYRIVPFFAAIALALLCTALATRWRFSRRDAACGVLAFAGWAVLASQANRMLELGDAGASLVVLIALAIAGAVALAQTGYHGLFPGRLAAPGGRGLTAPFLERVGVAGGASGKRSPRSGQRRSK